MLALRLCDVGWVCSIFGIGPGLDSISPHCSRVNMLKK